MLRTTLTGTHLLTTGELVSDVRELLDVYGFGEARSLIAIKQRAERSELNEGEAAHWTSEIERAFACLERAESESRLPAETPNVEELEAWLLELRRENW